MDRTPGLAACTALDRPRRFHGGGGAAVGVHRRARAVTVLAAGEFFRCSRTCRVRNRDRRDRAQWAHLHVGSEQGRRLRPTRPGRARRPGRTWRPGGRMADNAALAELVQGLDNHGPQQVSDRSRRAISSSRPERRSWRSAGSPAATTLRRWRSSRTTSPTTTCGTSSQVNASYRPIATRTLQRDHGVGQGELHADRCRRRHGLRPEHSGKEVATQTRRPPCLP